MIYIYIFIIIYYIFSNYINKFAHLKNIREATMDTSDNFGEPCKELNIEVLNNLRKSIVSSHLNIVINLDDGLIFLLNQAIQLSKDGL